MSKPPEEAAHEAANALAETARTAVAAGPEQTRKVARQEARRATRWLLPAAVVASLLISFGSTAYSAHTARETASVASRQANTDASLGALRRLAQQGYDAGIAANRQLAARGQQPVPIPAPGRADDTDVLVAAATAKVLAQLPKTMPTSAELGQSVADYFQQHPVVPAGPTPTELAASLAGYFATHPPPPGPTGPQGVPGQNGTNGQDGHTPTEAEIQQDFADYLASHPEALCPNGGTFTMVNGLISSDGTTYSGWLCVTSSEPPVSSTMPAPPTTTPPSAPLLNLGRK